MKRFSTFQWSLEDGQPIILADDDGDYVSYATVKVILEEIDRLAEAGLCQMSAGGKHAYLSDIRGEVAKLGIQGGLTKHGD